jgi:hypothetical protein
VSDVAHGPLVDRVMPLGLKKILIICSFHSFSSHLKFKKLHWGDSNLVPVDEKSDNL